MENQSKNVVLNEERISSWFEDKVLHERLGRIVVRLKLAKNIDEDSAVEHRLAIDRGDEMGDFLEGQRLQLLHDLHGALHLLTLE